VTRASTFAGAVRRVLEVCVSRQDSRALRLAVLDEIKRVIPVDAYAWLLTDPVTEVGCAPMADVPLPDLPLLIRLKYLTSVNRWTALKEPAAALWTATNGRPDASLVFRDLLRGCSVTDVASVVFRSRFGCWGFLDLWRMDGTYSGPELAFLVSISVPVTEALRGCQRTTFGLAATPGVRTGPIVLVMSPGLEVRAQTGETDEYLRILVPPGIAGRPIPAGAYNVAAQLLAREAGVDDHPASARVHLAGGTWVTLRAARIGDDEDATERDIAVTIELTEPAERLEVFGRASALSAREMTLLLHLVNGSDTRTVAADMFVSENTVQDHLKSIFRKTGASSRRALLAWAAGG
jgi:DNA-binding NarL/FixJ family response regulator